MCTHRFKIHWWMSPKSGVEAFMHAQRLSFNCCAWKSIMNNFYVWWTLIHWYSLRIVVLQHRKCETSRDQRWRLAWKCLSFSYGNLRMWTLFGFVFFILLLFWLKCIRRHCPHLQLPVALQISSQNCSTCCTTDWNFRFVLKGSYKSKSRDRMFTCAGHVIPCI